MDMSRHFGHAEWRTSTLCSSAGCVEVGFSQDMVGVRDSKDPSSPVLAFDAETWREFVAGVRQGEFDIPG
jgi:hypothetical protein